MTGLRGLAELALLKSTSIVDPKSRVVNWLSYSHQVQEIFELLRIDLVIDAGANRGQFAKKLRKFYRGEIHSFEPISFIFDELKSTSSNDPQWHVHNVALGSEAGEVSINVSKETVFSSILSPNEYSKRRFGADAQTVSEERITVRRLEQELDAITPDLANRKIYLKMDTQGYDLEVFRGLGAKSISILAMQSELSIRPIYSGMPHWIDCVSEYEKAGFSMIGMFPVTRDGLKVVEFDCLLVRDPDNPSV